jgi:transposase-like protein
VGGRGIDRPEDRCVPQTLLEWVKRAQTDSGERPGVSTSEARRVKELERKVKELRRANEILKLASAFFAQAELDRRLKVSVQRCRLDAGWRRSQRGVASGAAVDQW